MIDRQIVVLPVPTSPDKRINPILMSMLYNTLSRTLWWVWERKRNSGSGVIEKGGSFNL
jgi:hypothetical protein